MKKMNTSCLTIKEFEKIKKSLDKAALAPEEVQEEIRKTVEKVTNNVSRNNSLDKVCPLCGHPQEKGNMGGNYRSPDGLLKIQDGWYSLSTHIMEGAKRSNPKLRSYALYEVIDDSGGSL